MIAVKNNGKMQKSCCCILPFFILLVFLSSCQRELNFDLATRSSGFLKKDFNGSCAPVKVAATYTAEKNLADSNYIEAEVTVTTAGNYLIYTDTVNGYYFKSFGKFSAAGSYTVKLPGFGKPAADQTDNFTIKYDTSFCPATVVVKNNLSLPASFTLQGAPGICMSSIVEGAYVKGATLDTSDRVLVRVQVNVPGSYAISTNTVNGYSFSASGTFTATGPQVVLLAVIGVPANAGTDIFTVTAGSSVCTFSVTVLAPEVLNNSDYFPLTQGSLWVYDNNNYPNDSVKNIVNGMAAKNGNPHSIMYETIPFLGLAQSFYRKDNSNYYEYARADKYTTSFQYGTPVFGSILFLKENLAAGDRWLSDEYTGIASFGQQITTQYQFFCVAINAAVTINGKVFSNVYKIKLKPAIKSDANVYGYTNEEYDLYYAKGIGLIYLRKFLGGFSQYEQKIRRWVIN